MRRLLILSLLTVAATSVAAVVALSDPAPTPRLAGDLAAARTATAKYATDLGRARRDGYRILTRMIPGLGSHYLNRSVKGFDIRKPPILVYVQRGGQRQLGALEWVFLQRPATPPIKGARYGSFGAACHYVDGTLVFTDSENRCGATSPVSGARFNFWHGPLVTLHVWLWYPNPAGLFAAMNPLVTPFNDY